MRQSRIFAVLVLGLALVFSAAALYAAAAPEVIKMQAPYPHKKPIVMFSHKKHSTQYGAKCGDCHHDKDHKPLTTLKDGDPVQKCIVCHKLPGEAPPAALKGLTGAARTKKEVTYHATAMHDNCRECHKAWNKKNNKKPNEGAPIACNKCHAGK